LRQKEMDSNVTYKPGNVMSVEEDSEIKEEKKHT
jgi:hypothetical protein